MDVGSEADLGEEFTGVERRCKYHARPCPANRAVLLLLLISSLERYAFLTLLMTLSVWRSPTSQEQLRTVTAAVIMNIAYVVQY